MNATLVRNVVLGGLVALLLDSLCVYNFATGKDVAGIALLALLPPTAIYLIWLAIKWRERRHERRAWAVRIAPLILALGMLFPAGKLGIHLFEDEQRERVGDYDRLLYEAADAEREALMAAAGVVSIQKIDGYVLFHIKNRGARKIVFVTNVERSRDGRLDVFCVRPLQGAWFWARPCR